MSTRGADPIVARSLVRSGASTIRVGGAPLLSLRSEEREMDLDVSGAKAAGLTLSRLVETAGPDLVRGAASLGRRLSELGWTLPVSDGGEWLLALGHGASRVTGHVRLSSLRLRRLLAAIR